MDNLKNKKSGIFGFLVPYLLMAVAIIAFIWLVFFRSSGVTEQVSQNEIVNVLSTEEIKGVTSTQKETVTVIEGSYIDDESGKTVYFTCTFETDNTVLTSDVYDALMQLDPGVWTSVNAFETNWFET